MQAVTQQPRGADSKALVDPTLIDPFVESVKTVLRTMVGVETAVAEPHVRAAAAQYDVCGIIGFSGDLAGAVTVAFPKAAAERLVEAFTGAAIDVASPYFADAIGELANMIAGSAKSRLGVDASITVPSVVVGDGCRVAAPSDMPCVVIPCSTAAGEFAVEVCLRRKASA